MVTGKITEVVLDAIYPRICPLCKEIVRKRNADICPKCAKKLSYVEQPYCLRCGKPVDDGMEYCTDCSRRAHVYDEGRAALVYDEYMSGSIYAFKYNGKREFAAFYGRIMDERLGEWIRSLNVDAIIPVPIHKSKLKKRGYNQAQLIAKELAKRMQISVLRDAVTRRTATKVQKNLSAAMRQNNLKKAFIVTGNVVKLNSVLIVDDIYTTGATIDSMAGCLKGAGIDKVYFATLCIGRGN